MRTMRLPSPLTSLPTADAGLSPVERRRLEVLRMYRIIAADYGDALREIAAFAKRMADAERHHASIVYKGKKIESAKAAHCANQLDYLAQTLSEQMEIVDASGQVYRASWHGPQYQDGQPSVTTGD